MADDPPHIHPTQQALDDVIDTLAEPRPRRPDIAAVIVHRIYTELSATAVVDAHLIPLTQR
jgi:hypothetical protein